VEGLRRWSPSGAAQPFYPERHTWNRGIGTGDYIALHSSEPCCDWERSSGYALESRGVEWAVQCVTFVRNISKAVQLKPSLSSSARSAKQSEKPHTTLAFMTNAAPGQLQRRQDDSTPSGENLIGPIVGAVGTFNHRGMPAGTLHEVSNCAKEQTKGCGRRGRAFVTLRAKPGRVPRPLGFISYEGVTKLPYAAMATAGRRPDAGSRLS
jgi:hypothetical protein